jgi:dGTPase
MLNWDKLISERRLGLEDRPAQEMDDIRSIFLRDYDRIIFSSPFRRLQDKTQIFPLPGSIFVHNRLTHSIEVASVGRSLANIVIAGLNDKTVENLQTTISEISSIVSAACLAHDLGNPPFGHSGESAVADFFKLGNGSKYQESMSDEEWADFTCFEGNANALRVLTHQFKGKRPGGFTLTYSTIASFVKYPFESSLSEGKQKFGFFQSEKETFQNIASALGLVLISENPLKYRRHPLVYLVEAADDICYQIMDVEDAHKLKILTYAETEHLFLSFFDKDSDRRILDNIGSNLNIVTDLNERVAYMRAMVIGKLIRECANIFLENYERIADGEEIKSLFSRLTDPSRSAMNEVKAVSVEKIYNDSSVVEIEIAGYKILGTLLETFISAVIEPDNYMSGKLLSLIPSQYKDNGESTYSKIQSVVDFVSGMTDLYALDLYQKITGMNLPGIA